MSATSDQFDRHTQAAARSHRGSPPAGQAPRVLFVNRSYWPESESTGQLLTELAEDLAAQFQVTVLAGHPNVNPSGADYRAPGANCRNGVRIVRAPHTRMPKRFLPARALNLATFFLSAVARGAVLPRHDVIVLETDPFLLALAGRFLRWRHRGKLILYLQDIHPDLGVAIGRLPDHFVISALGRALRRAYRAADRVIVLSDDMRRTLTATGLARDNCETIPNWVDTRAIRPLDKASAFRRREGIAADRCVVMYSGNLGATQQLETLIQAAALLQNHNQLLFCLVGAGAAESSLRSQVAERKLENVRFFPYQPKEQLSESLAAADIHLVSAHPKALAYLMPSKLYGILAAGRPVLAAVAADSDLARLVAEEHVGTVVPPGNVHAMAVAIEKALSDPAQRSEMGRRARELAETRFDRRLATGRFARLIEELTDHPPRKAPSALALKSADLNHAHE